MPYISTVSLKDRNTMEYYKVLDIFEDGFDWSPVWYHLSKLTDYSLAP